MKLNEVYHLIIYCLNCIRRDQNSTYKTGLRKSTVKRDHSSLINSHSRVTEVYSVKFSRVLTSQTLLYSI
jgi:hypothetical protein